jgi:hypothetical protein
MSPCTVRCSATCIWPHRILLGASYFIQIKTSLNHQLKVILLLLGESIDYFRFYNVYVCHRVRWRLSPRKDFQNILEPLLKTDELRCPELTTGGLT